MGRQTKGEEAPKRWLEEPFILYELKWYKASQRKNMGADG